MDPPECSGHSHDHDHIDELGLSLRKYMDVDHVLCLNEEVEGSGRAVLKMHDERLSSEPSLVSADGDPELILLIPFTEAVTVHSITIRNASGNDATSSARRVKVFTNLETLGFEEAREMPGQMEFELLPPDHFADGTIDYPCRPAGRFQSITSLCVYVMSNYDDTGESSTEITYVGLKGKGTNVKRIVVETVYEAQGMPKDHKVRDEYGNRSIV